MGSNTYVKKEKIFLIKMEKKFEVKSTEKYSFSDNPNST